MKQTPPFLKAHTYTATTTTTVIKAMSAGQQLHTPLPLKQVAEITMGRSARPKKRTARVALMQILVMLLLLADRLRRHILRLSIKICGGCLGCIEEIVSMRSRYRERVNYNVIILLLIKLESLFDACSYQLHVPRPINRVRIRDTNYSKNFTYPVHKEPLHQPSTLKKTPPKKRHLICLQIVRTRKPRAPATNKSILLLMHSIRISIQA